MEGKTVVLMLKILCATLCISVYRICTPSFKMRHGTSVPYPSYTIIRKNLPIRFHKFSGVDKDRADTASLGSPKRQKIVVCSAGLDFILLT